MPSDNKNEHEAGLCDILVHNSFADLLLIIGLDENTGLKPTNKQGDEPNSPEDLCDQCYEPQVLVTIAANSMVNLFPFPHEDKDYPVLTIQDYSCLLSFVDNGSPLKSSKKPKRSFTKSPAHLSSVPAKNTYLHRSKSFFSKKGKSIAFGRTISHGIGLGHTSPEIPISDEVLKSIATFCFPDNMKIYSHAQPTSCHFLVLTDVTGLKTYATCITFTRPYLVELDFQNRAILELDTSAYEWSDRRFRCHIPHCCVLVSKFPYFSTMKDVLSFMVSKICERQQNMLDFCKVFARTLTLTPVPCPGYVSMEMKILGTPFHIYPPEKADKPVIDIPLHLVFLCFQNKEILRILSAILMEERIVFLSSSYSLLTIIIESFFNFILPFRWKFTYVPVLSVKSIDLLDAPGTFIMGCHSQHLSEAKQVPGLVLVNIDDGSVTINADKRLSSSSVSSADYTEKVDVPDLPIDPANQFLKVCNKARVYFDLDDMQRPTCLDITKEMKYKKMRINKLNKEIALGCLELMVNLFRGVLSEVTVEFQNFNQQQFINKQIEEDKPFYSQVVQKEMFKQFLDERMSDKIDYWKELDMKTRQHYVRQANPSDLKTSTGRRKSMGLKRSVCLSISSEFVDQKEYRFFQLPETIIDKKYLSCRVEDLTNLIKRCKEMKDRASLLYLKAVYLTAQGKYLDAMTDIIALTSMDLNLTPRDLVFSLYQNINDEEKTQARNLPAFGAIQEIIEEEEHLAAAESSRLHTIDGDLQIPDTDLTFSQFSRALFLYEMTQDYESISRLFKALSGNSLDTYAYITYDTFSTFRLYYENNHELCSAVIGDRDLEPSESVLKVSSLCKTDLGSGRVVLTDKRLLLIRDSSKDFKEIVKLRDIESLEKVQVHFIVFPLDVLKIQRKNNKKCTLWLKEERNQMYTLIQEMWSGKVIADATKDLSLVQQVAQNVLLLDALITSGQEKTVTHYECLEKSIEQMCWYTQRKEAADHILPKDTSHALKNKLDPNLGEQERNSVQALLYTPGDHHLVSPRLWCGLVNGKIKVFDGTNWTLEKEFVQVKKSLSCLTAVGPNQVWVGSFDIYIIDTLKIHSSSFLSDHGEFVIDIIYLSEAEPKRAFNNKVYSASVDGTIIEWNAQSLEKVSEIKLDTSDTLRKIQYHNDFLWCGLWKSIMKVNLSGTVVQKIDFDFKCSDIKIYELESFLLVPDRENNKLKLWIGCRRDPVLIIVDPDDLKVQETKILDQDCKGVSAMAKVKNVMWTGTKSGIIYSYNTDTFVQTKKLEIHRDAVRALCCVEDRYVLSGAGSQDGRIAVWNTSNFFNESFDKDFEIVE